MRYAFVLILIVVGLAIPGRSQPQDDPVGYLDYFTSRDVVLAQSYLSYMVSVAHSASEPGVAAQRKQVVEGVDKLRKELAAARAYQQDGALRDAYREYLEALHTVFDVDYPSLERDEQGLDASIEDMKHLLERKESAFRKVASASHSKQTAWKAFADRNEIMLVVSERDLAAQVDQVVNVGIYYNNAYLVFYTSVNREMALIRAFDAQNAGRIRAAQETLLQSVERGLLRIDSLGSFEGDPALQKACRQMLQFHLNEAELRSRPLLDFVVLKERFEAYKAGFTAKATPERSKTEVEDYNRMVRELNEASETANRVVVDLNAERIGLTEQWNQAVNTFLREHIH